MAGLKRSIKFLIFITLFLTRANSFTGEAPAGISEMQIRAGFIFNFLKFVEWPEDVLTGAGPIVIGVWGNDDIYETLSKTVQDRTLERHSITVRRISAPGDADACHLILFGGTRNNDVRDFLASARSSSVFTVGRDEHFKHSGTLFYFTIEDNRLGFNVNADALAHTRMKISSRLLQLARSGGRKP